MTAEAADSHRGPAGRAVVSSKPAFGAERIHSSAELVALSERFNHGIFMGALGFVAVSALTALAFLPLRESADHGRPPASAVVAVLVVLALTGLAIWRARDVNRLLRRRPELELVPVLIAALLLSVVSPLRNELWWPACAILMVLALQMSLRRALTYCLIVLLANLTAHTVAGDLSETSPVAIIGLWIGLPFWTATAAVIPDRMARHILRLNATRNPPSVPPRRVPARETFAHAPDPGCRPVADSSRNTSPSSGLHARRELTSRVAEASPKLMSRLTTRQLQVVLLLADGHRYQDVGAYLSISAGQVYRHVASAVERMDVQNVNELVAVAVAEGVAPG